MLAFAKFVDAWGWPFAFAIATLYFLAKNWRGLWDRLAQLLPLLAHRQRSRYEADTFQREQQTKVHDLTLEQQERRDTIRVLTETLKELRADRDDAQTERKILQDQLIEIVKTQSRREAEITGAIQSLAQLVTLQTERLSQQTNALSALTSVIERIVGSFE